MGQRRVGATVPILAGASVGITLGDLARARRDPIADIIASAIDSVLQGGLPYFELEYPLAGATGSGALDPSNAADPVVIATWEAPAGARRALVRAGRDGHGASSTMAATLVTCGRRSRSTVERQEVCPRSSWAGPSGHGVGGRPPG